MSFGAGPEERVEYRDGGARLSGFLTRPDGTDGRPGVLVVHGGAGVDDHARTQARRLAGLGFVALACDMYGSEVTGNRDRVLGQIGEFRGDRDKLTRRAEAALAVLAADPRVDGRIAAVGYCFGGLVVLELARAGLELAAVVSVHGTLATARPAATGTIKGSILVCHGALDPYVPPAQLAEFMSEMNSAGADWELVVLGGALHGFTHTDARGDNGVAYDPGADARSFRAMAGFLDEVFARA